MATRVRVRNEKTAVVSTLFAGCVVRSRLHSRVTQRGEDDALPPRLRFAVAMADNVPVAFLAVLVEALLPSTSGADGTPTLILPSARANSGTR